MSAIGHNSRRLGGWVAVTREMREHWLVGFGQPVAPMDPERGSLSRAEAWLDLIMECRYEEGTVNNGGRKMVLQPGQLVGAVSWLAARWNWSPKTVRTWLDRLATEGMIELVKPGQSDGTQKGKQATVITVCKFTEYQNLPVEEGQANNADKGDQRASKGQAKGKQGASKGQHTKDNKGTREQDSPPTPSGSGETTGEVNLFGDELPEEHAGRRQIEEAFEVYNKAAEHFHFGKCEILSTGRYDRLQKRLVDIGGIENYKIALRALANLRDPFCRFLLGRAPARAGQEPFRLTLERLLQTDGSLGDVLIRLFEIGKQSTARAGAGGNAVTGEVWWKDPAKVAAMTADDWRELIAKHANGVWPSDKLGPAPGKNTCLVPRSVIRELHLEDRYTPQGTAREPH